MFLRTSRLVVLFLPRRPTRDDWTVEDWTTGRPDGGLDELMVDDYTADEAVNFVYRRQYNYLRTPDGE